jgi:DNA-directed RNA polymerase specialized sigma subunit
LPRSALAASSGDAAAHAPSIRYIKRSLRPGRTGSIRYRLPGASGTDTDLILADRLGDTDDELDLVEDRESLCMLLAVLPVRQRRILAMRFYGDLSQAYR